MSIEKAILLLALVGFGMAFVTTYSSLPMKKWLTFSPEDISTIEFDLAQLIDQDARENTSIALKISSSFPVWFKIGNGQMQILENIAPVLDQKIYLGWEIFEGFLNFNKLVIEVTTPANALSDGWVSVRVADRISKNEDLPDKLQRCNTRLVADLRTQVKLFDIFRFIDCDTEFPEDLESLTAAYTDEDEDEETDADMDEDPKDDGEEMDILKLTLYFILLITYLIVDRVIIRRPL